MSVEYDILGGFIDPASFDDFKKLNALADESAKKMEALAKVKDSVFKNTGRLNVDSDLKKQVEQLDKLQGQMTAMQQKYELDIQKIKEQSMAKIEALQTQHLAKMEQLEKASQAKADLQRASLEAKEKASAERKADNAIAAAKREADATARALAKEQVKSFNASQAGINSKTDIQSQAQVMKLNAIMASEYTTALQKLDAQIRLNIIDAQKFVAANDTQNPKYLELIGNTKQLSTEYDRMAKASGAAQMKTSSMYGATFSLTQVMRELPNFAISARIGFMALSNNLPMLAESFSRVRHEIDAVTGKEKGFKGAMKEFGSSLLSLNTIMIVASTLLVLYGDEITAWVEKVLNGVSASDKFTLSQKAMIRVLSDQNSAAKSNVEKILELGVAIDTYKKGTGSAKDIVEKYNETLGTHYGKLKDINSVMEEYPKHAQSYIDWSVRMAAAMSQVDEAAKLVLQIQLINEELKATYSQSNISAVEALNRRIKDSFEGKDTKNGLLVQQKMTESAKERAISDIRNYGEINKKVSERITAQEKLDKMMKSASELYPGGFSSKKDDSDKAKKTFTEINVLRVMYDKQHADLVEKAAQLEQDITKSNLDGELNSYDKRTAAAELYYKIISELSNKDKEIAIQNESAKMAKEKDSLKQKYENNVRKFGAKSPEAAKSLGELNTGNSTIEANNADAILKITDEFDKKILDAARKKQKDLNSINQDIYADKVYLLEREKQKELEVQGISANEQKASTARKSPFEILNSKLGGSSSNNVQALKDAENDNQARLDIEREALQKEYDLQKTSGEKKVELARKIAENIHTAAMGKITLDRDIDLENAKMVEDAKASIISDSIDTLKSLWDSYYQYQQDKIDETLKKQTAANEESVKQYEDETDAGMHTAKQLSDYKDRIAAYQQSQDDAAAEKKKQLEKEQFLAKQAAAVAEVWINYAINVAKNGVNPVAQAWLLGSAIASTALIAAQTFPAFAEGGTMEKDGKAWVGDGGKNELVMTPTGDWYVTPKVPTVVDMKAGTKIFPDINKLDLNSFLAMAQVQPQMLKTDNLEKEIRGLRSDVRNQKQGNFYGMPLIRQLNNSDRYSARRRGLMN